MTSDPFAVMSAVVTQELSRLQANADLELLGDASAIAQAETQRTRIRDRFDAACGSWIQVHGPGGVVQGRLSTVGEGLILLESDVTCQAISMAAIVSIDSLPHALRQESAGSPRVSVTWSSVLRDWSASAFVRLSLADGRHVCARIESVGSDHADIRDSDGVGQTVMLAAIRSAVISR